MFDPATDGFHPGADRQNTEATAAMHLLKCHAGEGQSFFDGGILSSQPPQSGAQKNFPLYPLPKMKVAQKTPTNLAAMPNYAKAGMPGNLGR